MQNWNDADMKLREIALIDVRVAEAKAECDRRQLDAQTDYSLITAPLLASREVIAGELETFYKSQRKKVEAEGKRSMELNHGRLGMRLGKPTLALVKGWKWDKVLYAIKERWSRKPDLLEAIVTTKESVNKDGVKAHLAEDDLARVGLKIKQDDEFFLEVFQDTVQRA